MKELTIAGVTVKALTEDDLITIEPSLARTLMLQNNDNFRKVSPNEVSKYSKVMRGGAWRFNGDTIAIDKDGKLKDGQHRQYACISTGIPFKIFPVMIDDDTTIDNKKRLEFEDILSSLGYKNARNLASTIKILYRYENKYPNYITVSQTIDNNTALEFFNANKDIVDSFNTALMYFRDIGMSHSAVAFIYHVTRKLDADMARELIRIASLKLSDYDNLRITNLDAMYHFKKTMNSETKDNSIPSVMKIALLIKTWNYWRNNTICNNLVWKCTGPTPEEFPRIV